MSFICIILLISFQSNQRGLIPFEKEGLWGYRDSSSRIIIEPKYIAAEEFTPFGIAAIADDSGWAYIDSTGKILVRPFIFDNAPDEFREGLARCISQNQFGFFDERGKIVVEPRYDFALPFSEGLAAVCKGCKKNPVIDDEGKPSDEHFIYSGGKWGYINKKGKIIIPFKYNEAGNFKNGKAIIKLDGQSLTIDKKGKVTKK